MLNYKKKTNMFAFFILSILLFSTSFSGISAFSNKCLHQSMKNITVQQGIGLPASVMLLDNDLYPMIVSAKNTVLSNYLFYTRLNNGSIIGVEINVIADTSNKNIVVEYVNKTFDTTLNCTDLNFAVYLPSSMGSIYRQLIFYYRNVSIIYTSYNTTYYMVKLEMTRPYVGDTLIEKYLKYKDFVPPASINYTFLVSKKDGKAYWVNNNKTIYCGYLPFLPPVIINQTWYWLKILNNIDTLIKTIKENKDLLIHLVQKMENENSTQRFDTITRFTNNIDSAIFGIRYKFFSTILTLSFLGNSIEIFQDPLVKEGIKELSVKVVSKKHVFPDLNKIADELKPGVNRFINDGDLKLLQETIIRIIDDLVVSQYKRINITQASGSIEVPLNKRYISEIILPSTPYIREKLGSPYLLISLTGADNLPLRIKYEGFNVEHMREVIANQYSRIEYLWNFLQNKIGDSLTDMVARGEVNESKIISVLEKVREYVIDYIVGSCQSSTCPISEPLPSNTSVSAPGQEEKSTMTKNTAGPATHWLLAVPVIISITITIVFLLLRRRRG